MKTIEIFGWYGTVAIIFAYFLNSFDFISSSDILYQLLNISGALGIAIISFKKEAYQPMVLNIIWTVIGILALFKIFL